MTARKRSTISETTLDRQLAELQLGGATMRPVKVRNDFLAGGPRELSEGERLAIIAALKAQVVYLREVKSTHPSDKILTFLRDTVAAIDVFAQYRGESEI